MGIRAAREFERSPRLRGRSNAAPTDEQLVERCRNGDSEAFATVVSRYETMLTRHCARIVGPSAAEDAVQEAFIAAWVALGSGAEVHDLKPWLFQIARRKAFKTRDPRDVTELSESVPGGRSSEEEAAGSAQARAVLAAVAALPATQRDALVGSALHGRSGLQLARQLGTTAPNVRQLVFRARERVRLAAAACIAPPLALLRFLRHQAAGQAAAAPGSMAAATALKTGVALVAVAAAGTAAGIHLSQAASPPPRHLATRASTNATADPGFATTGLTRRQFIGPDTTSIRPSAVTGRPAARIHSRAAAATSSVAQVAALRQTTTPSALQTNTQSRALGGLAVAPGGAGAQAKALLGGTNVPSPGVRSVVPGAAGILTTLPATASKLTSTAVGPVVGPTGATAVSVAGAAVQGATGAVTGAAAGAVNSVGSTPPAQLPVQVAPAVGAVAGAASSTAQSAVNTVEGALPIGSH